MELNFRDIIELDDHNKYAVVSKIIFEGKEYVIDNAWTLTGECKCTLDHLNWAITEITKEYRLILIRE